MNLWNWITHKHVKKAVPVVAIVVPILFKPHGKPMSITRDITVGETMIHGQFYDYYQDVGGQG